MTNIFCTKKLEKLLGKKIIAHEPVPDNVLGNWNANLFSMNGRKCLIVMNDISYYSLIFLDILKQDMVNFHEIFYQRLIEQLSYDQVNFPVSCSPILMKACEPVFLRTNNNRKVLGTMNQFVQDTEYLFQRDYYGDLKLVDISELNNRITDNLVSALGQGSHNFESPLEAMHKKIKEVCV